jgi:two-component system sensor histidine kinase KdpD
MPALPPASSGEQSFADLLQTRERGKLKLYVGSAAGTGKTFRMLNEAHQLRQRGVDVVVGYVETHGRAETEAQIGDLEIVPRKRIEYRGVTLEEMDVAAVIARRPQVAIVDELAHTNVPGAGRGKRWEDVIALLDEGISVISALNVQHLESLNDVLQKTLGVTVRETVPDWVISLADQVVNLDISAEDLRQRLMEGKIYSADKVATALSSFFTEENLTTLRELALREVASSVDRSREGIAARGDPTPAGTRAAERRTVDRILVAMSSHPEYTAVLLRKASRIAGRLNRDWYCVYVQTPAESATRIDASVQRKLVENIQRAQAMGAEVVKLESPDVAGAIRAFARDKGVTLIIVGQSQPGWWRHLTHGSIVARLTRNPEGVDVLVVSLTAPKDEP